MFLKTELTYMLHLIAIFTDKIIDTLRSFFDNAANNLVIFIHTHPALFFFLLASSILRLWNLPTHAIFFGDAGRDFLASIEMLETGQIPLKGIPTSIPIFHQSPLMIWYIGAMLWLTNMQTEIVFVITAMIGTLTVGWLYLSLHQHFSTSILPIVATLILTFSPLAVAHSRMTYHITFIPLFTLCYLLSLTKVAKNEKHGVIFSAICWGLLLQLELSLFPLIVAIPYTLWRYKKIDIQKLKLLGVGLVLSVIPFLTQLPTVLSFLSNRLQNGTKITSELLEIVTEFIPTVHNFWLYFTRFVSIDQPVIGIIYVVFFILSFYAILRNFNHLSPIIDVTLFSFLILTLAYFIRGVPSEAYMPPYFIFLPILLSYGLLHLIKSKIILKQFIVTMLIIWAGWSSLYIFQNNFFVQPTQSEFHYGVSYGEQKNIVKTIYTETNGKPYVLDSISDENRFASFLDNFRYIGEELSYPETYHASSIRYFIEYHDSLLANYPNADIIYFPSRLLIHIPEIN